jgi:TP901 family phage tail tape measure protein
MSASSFAISAILSLKDGMSSGIQKASDGVKSLANSAKGLLQFTGIAGAIGAAFGGLTFASAISSATAFESAMLTVKAALQGGGIAGVELQSQYAALTAEAERLGATTNFTAQQAAEGFEVLIKSGFSATDAIQALEHVMAFAQGTGLTLAESATFVADAMGAFGLEASDTQRITDVLNATANSAAMTIEQLQSAMKNSAVAAKASGLSIEQTGAALAVLASSGVKAEVAGSSFTSMLKQFNNPASLFRKELAALGITTGDFREALIGLEAAGARGSRALLALGDEGGRAGQILVTQGVSAFDKFNTTIETSTGSTLRAANTMNEGLGGAFSGLSSAVDGAMIQLAKPIMQPLSDGVRTLTAYISELSDSGAFEKIGQEVSINFQIAGMAMSDLIAQASKLPDAFDTLSDSSTDVGLHFKALGSIFADIGAQLRESIPAVDNWVNHFRILGDANRDTGLEVEAFSLMFSDLKEALFGGGESADKASESIDGLGDSSDKTSDAVGNVSDSVGDLDATASDLSGSMDSASDSLDGVGDSSDGASDSLSGVSDSATDMSGNLDAVTTSSDGVGESLDSISTSGDSAIDSLDNVASSGENYNEVVDSLTGSVYGLSDMLDNTASSGTMITNSLIDASASGIETGYVFDELTGTISKLSVGFEETAQASEEASQTIEQSVESAKAVADAYSTLGIRSQTSLQNIATVAQTAFETIANSGTASSADIEAAFMAFATKSLEASNGVISDDLKMIASKNNLGAALDGLKTSNSNIALSFKELGITSTAELQSVADKFKNAFEAIASDSESSLSDIERAFEKYADSAIQANDGVISSDLEAIASKKGMLDILNQMGAAASKAQSEVNAALSDLGVKSTASLQAAANKAKASFDTIKNSGLATKSELKQAFEAYARSAIEANDGVASSELRAEAAAAGMSGTLSEMVSSGGKAVGTMNSIGSAAESAGKKAEAAAKQVERLKAAATKDGGGSGGSRSEGWSITYPKQWLEVSKAAKQAQEALMGVNEAADSLQKRMIAASRGGISWKWDDRWVSGINRHLVQIWGIAEAYKGSLKRAEHLTKELSNQTGVIGKTREQLAEMAKGLQYLDESEMSGVRGEVERLLGEADSAAEGIKDTARSLQDELDSMVGNESAVELRRFEDQKAAIIEQGKISGENVSETLKLAETVHKKKMEMIANEGKSEEDVAKARIDAAKEAFDAEMAQRKESLDALKEQGNAYKENAGEQKELINDLIDAEKDKLDVTIDGINEQIEKNREAADAIKESAEAETNKIKEQSELISGQFKERKDAVNSAMELALSAIDKEQKELENAHAQNIKRIDTELKEKEKLYKLQEKEAKKTIAEDEKAFKETESNLSKKIEAIEKESEARIKQSKERFDKENQLLSEQEKKAKDAAAKEKQQIERDIKAQKAALESQITAAKSKLKGDELEAEIAALKESHSEKIQLLENEKSSRVEQNREILDGIQTAKQQSREAHEELLRQIKEESDARIEAIRAQIEAAKEAHTQKIESIKQELEAKKELLETEKEEAAIKKESLTEDNSKKIADIEAQKQSVKDSFDEQLNAIQMQADEQKKHHDARIAQIEAENKLKLDAISEENKTLESTRKIEKDKFEEFEKAEKAKIKDIDSRLKLELKSIDEREKAEKELMDSIEKAHKEKLKFIESEKTALGQATNEMKRAADEIVATFKTAGKTVTNINAQINTNTNARQVADELDKMERRKK